MAEPVKRKRAYSSVVRREQAAQNTRAILDAAADLFLAEG